MDDRMSSLLRLCGLDARQLIEGETWEDGPIDYGSVGGRLDGEIERSMAYLDNALGE